MSIYWYKWEPQRWRNSVNVAGMSLAERGAYRELLDFQITQPNGKIPNKPELFWKFANTTPQEWDAVKDNVLKMFTVSDDGAFLVNATAYEFWSAASNKCAAAAEAGRKGGRATQARAKAGAQSDGEQPSSDCSTEKKREDQKRVKKPSGAGAPGDEPSEPRWKDCCMALDEHLKLTVRDESARPPFNEMVSPLKALLTDKPNLTVGGFRKWLSNRAASDKVNFCESPRKWIPQLYRYGSGPLDEYGKPKKAVSLSAPAGKSLLARVEAQGVGA